MSVVVSLVASRRVVSRRVVSCRVVSCRVAGRVVSCRVCLAYPTPGNLRCYELFTLYLSTLSVETVAHHDRELVSVLLNRTMK